MPDTETIKISSLTEASTLTDADFTVIDNGTVTKKFKAKSFQNVTDIKVNNNSVLSNKIANITVPTKTSDITNDSGFVTSSYHDSSKQNTLVSGTNIKTINNQSLLESGNISIQGIYYVTKYAIKSGSTITLDEEFTLSEYNTLCNNNSAIILKVQTAGTMGTKDFILNKNNFDTDMSVPPNTNLTFLDDTYKIKITAVGTTISSVLSKIPSLVTYISASSTDTQYPSAKCVYDYYTTISGYDSSKTQVLKNVSGVLTWVDE